MAATRNTDNIHLNDITPTDINNTGGILKELKTSWCKLILRSQVDVAKGLVKGAIRFIIDIVWPNFQARQSACKPPTC